MHVVFSTLRTVLYSMLPEFLRNTVLILSIMFCSLFATAGEPATVSTPASTLQNIITSGELNVGVSVFPPWVMRAKSGDLIGSEIDMANRLGKDMNLAVRFSAYDWKDLIAALEKGEIDIIVSGMAIKPDRALRVNFSRPYADAGIGLAANTALTKKFASLSELKEEGVKLGVISETVSAEVAKRLFPKTTIQSFVTEQQAEQALVKGELHALIVANPLPKFLTLKYPGKIDEPLVRPLISFKEGLVIRKGDADFLAFLDAWVVARTADQWIPSMRRYWHESLEWQQQTGE